MTTPGARGVLLEQICDQGLEGIELARTETADRRRHRSPEVLFHGAGGPMEMTGDAAHRPVLATGEPMDFVNLLRVQHGSGYKPPPPARPEGCSLQAASQRVGKGSTG